MSLEIEIDWSFTKHNNSVSSLQKLLSKKHRISHLKITCYCHCKVTKSHISRRILSFIIHNYTADVQVSAWLMTTSQTNISRIIRGNYTLPSHICCCLSRISTLIDVFWAIDGWFFSICENNYGETYILAGLLEFQTNRMNTTT